MKRAVICVNDPWNYINQLNDYSIMIINPNSTESRNQYLLAKSDYSLLITEQGEQYRDGQDYPDEKLLWYTSGTTGDSKFCSFTQTQLDMLAHKICNTYNITANDRYTSIMSLWHAHGQGFYWATKLAGCEVNFIPVKDLRNLSKFSPTFITAVPDVLKAVGQLNFDSLRFIRGASSALPNQLYKDLKTKFRVPIIEAFGMTEALSHCFTNPLYGEQRIGTVGLPDGIEADIVDGQLYIKGPTLFTNDWYNTGDLAERDDQGYYRIIGRHKDQINIKGKKLNPISLESQLLANVNGIIECVIFGTNTVKCLYVGSCSPEDITKFLVSLGKHCQPRLVKKVEQIPVAPSDKISRTWLDSKIQ